MTFPPCPHFVCIWNHAESGGFEYHPLIWVVGLLFDNMLAHKICLQIGGLAVLDGLFVIESPAMCHELCEITHRCGMPEQIFLTAFAPTIFI